MFHNEERSNNPIKHWVNTPYKSHESYRGQGDALGFGVITGDYPCVSFDDCNFAHSTFSVLGVIGNNEVYTGW